MVMGARINTANLPIVITTPVRALKRLMPALFVAGLVALVPVSGAFAEPATPVAVPTLLDSDDSAPERISREYLIKAAILYNLAKFATWPDTAFSSADAPVRMCILGRDPFGPALASLQGKRIGRRKLAVTASVDVEFAAACHVLFVSASEEYRLAEILQTLSKSPVLTVADFQHFANAGGMVGLTELDDRSRLEINVDAAGQAGLKLSSKLLRLAVTVDTQTAQFDAAPEK